VSRTGLPGRSSRRLAITAAAVFVVSSAFPVVAGLSRDTASFPRWWGILDVSVAFLLAILAFAVAGLAQNKIDQKAINAGYRAYRVLIHAILLLLVVFFTFGDRITWINCLTGFAWRAWLLAYCLPAWHVAFRAAANSSAPGTGKGQERGAS
jgi:hypothetical protein